MHQYVSADRLCSLTESFIARYIMSKWWTVTCDYQLMNRRIAGTMILLANIYILLVRVWTVQKYTWARLYHRADSQSVTKTTNNFNKLWKQLSMAPDVGWTMSQNERQWSINDFWTYKYGKWIVIWSLFGVNDVLAAFQEKRDSNTVNAPF